MVCGIYKLTFENTDKVYIGQSNNISNRYKQHITSMKNSSASSLLQEAYRIYGTPNIETILECTEAELDEAETEAIEIFKSVNNGFNTLTCSTDIPRFTGENHGRSLYTNKQVESVLFCIVNNPEWQLSKVSNETSVSTENIYLIANGTNHCWLKSLHPKEYATMLKLSGNRRSSCQSASNRGITYPAILSPWNEVFYIENISAFSRKYNLDDGHLGKVLRGKAKTHKGWKLHSP